MGAMDGLRHQFLAGAGLALDQHVGRRARNRVMDWRTVSIASESPRKSFR
jgi:hypothetical protein